MDTPLTDLTALIEWNELLMQSKAKVVVAALSISAAAFVGYVANHEGYVGTAMVPTKGDKPTIGFGSTFHEDGRPVRMGDKTDPVNALKKAMAHVTKEEEIFKKSLDGAYLSQKEYDLYMDFVYQYGTGTWQKSSMRRLILQNKHPEACKALLNYRFAAGYDCSTPGNKRCYGVWTRQQERYKTCMAAQ